MTTLFDVIKRFQFWASTERLGPDMLSTHLRLFFPKSARKLCVKKLKFFGENAEIRPGSYLIYTKSISLGRNVVIRPSCHLHADPQAEIIIEDDVMLGSGVHIYVDNHEFGDPSIPIIQQGYGKFATVTLKKGCWIGACAVILPGVTIGENAVVAAGAIVTKNVDPRTVVGGNPAKVIKHITETALEAL